MQAAKYKLTRVKELAAGSKILFSHDRATVLVMENLQITVAEAEIFMIEGINSLSEDNFSERLLMWGDVYDVYGIIINGIPWYIKFSIFKDGKNEECLYNISFHPIEKQLITKTEVLEKYVP